VHVTDTEPAAGLSRLSLCRGGNGAARTALEKQAALLKVTA